MSIAKKIKYLKIEFEGELPAHQIPSFRGAIIKKVGLEHDVFHNHNGDKFIYSYPLVQYKTWHKRPTLLCLENGVDEIHHFFSQKDWTLNINDSRFPVKIARMDMHRKDIQVWKDEFEYRIYNWIGLNQIAYRQYQRMNKVQEQITFLEKKLIGNILSFAKGIDWHIDEQVKVNISAPLQIRPVRIKEQKLLGFNLNFRTNIYLPNFIGLGKSVSIGYGVVKIIKN